MGQRDGSRSWSNDCNDLLDPNRPIQPIGHGAAGVRVIPNVPELVRFSLRAKRKVFVNGEACPRDIPIRPIRRRRPFIGERLTRLNWSLAQARDTV